MTHPAKLARLSKERHPEAYCPNPRCLWRRGSGDCPTHSPRRVSTNRTERKRKA